MNIYLVMLMSLFLTILIEVIVFLIMHIGKGKDIINVILVNVLTNPLVVSISFYVNIRYGFNKRMIMEVILELLAIICEGFIYSKVLESKKINGYLISLILNIVSYSLGLVLNMIIWG